MQVLVEIDDPDTNFTEVILGPSPLPRGVSFKINFWFGKPAYNQAGEYDFTVTVNDPPHSATRSFKIVVENANRRPLIEDINDVTVKLGDEVRVSLDVRDPDGDPYNVWGQALPDGADIEGDSVFVWTPDQLGSFGILIRASDGDKTGQASLYGECGTGRSKRGSLFPAASKPDSVCRRTGSI